MGTCRDCKYWKRSDIFWGNTVGECKLLQRSAAGVLGKHIGDAVIENVSTYTRPVFGCVHFEEREKEPFRVTPGRGNYEGHSGEYAVEHADGCMMQCAGWWPTEEHAQRAAKSLNRMWSERCDCDKGKTAYY